MYTVHNSSCITTFMETTTTTGWSQNSLKEESMFMHDIVNSSHAYMHTFMMLPQAQKICCGNIICSLGKTTPPLKMVYRIIKFQYKNVCEKDIHVVKAYNGRLLHKSICIHYKFRHGTMRYFTEKGMTNMLSPSTNIVTEMLKKFILYPSGCGVFTVIM